MIVNLLFALQLVSRIVTYTLLLAETFIVWLWNSPVNINEQQTLKSEAK